MLRWENDQGPKVIHTLSHDCHSLETVVAAAQGVLDSLDLPEQPNGYRITTEAGTELYGWAGRSDAIRTFDDSG
jgi:hypothetical protein